MDSSDEDLSKIIMQGVHVDLTPALQEAIQQRFAALLRHDARILRINVRLHQDQKVGQRHHYAATAQVEVPGPDVVARAEDLDAYAALDALAQKLDQLLDRKHGKRLDKRDHPKEIELDASVPKHPRELEDLDSSFLNLGRQA